MQDRRRFPRCDCTLQMKYGPEGKDKQSGYTISNDISKGGISMPALSGVVNKGDIIKLDIILTRGKYHISATGKVKWVKPINRMAPLDEEVGIEFVIANPEEIERLINTGQKP